MRLKLFAGSDFLRCADTFVNVFNQEPWNDKWSAEAANEYLLDYMNTPGFTGVVAEDEEEVCGFIFGVRKRWWSGDEFFINEMCVSVKKQQAGVGSQLLKFLEQELEAKGIQNITLLTERDIPAETFYKKNGFTEIERLIFLNKNINGIS